MEFNNETHFSMVKPLKTFFEDCYYYKIVTHNIVTQHELIIYKTILGLHIVMHNY